MKKTKQFDVALNYLHKDYIHILEFGVYQGNSIKYLKKILKNNYKIFGFDSFIGLPEDWINQENKIVGNGFCKKTAFDAGGNVPDIEGVKFFKGWFEETIPEYLKIAEPIALLHIDCDLYSSTKTVLYNLKEYIKSGTVIIFDEWIFESNPIYNNHEQKCFYEWVKNFSIKYEFIDFEHEYPGFCEQKIVKIL